MTALYTLARVGGPLLAISLAMWAVHGSLVLDNYGQVHWEDALFWGHRDEHIHSFSDCFSNPLWPGLYRPLTTNCYYYVVGLFAERSVAVHHLINVLLYAANGLLLSIYCLRFLPWHWALAAGVFYVSRSAHAEVLTNSVEFQVLLSVFFSLLALIWFEQSRSKHRRWPLVLSCTALALALLSKESTVVTPVLMGAAGWFFLRRVDWRLLLAPLSVTLVWVALFVTVFRSLSDYAPTGFSYSFAPLDLLRNYSVYLLSFANVLAYAPDNRILPEKLEAVAGAEVALVGLALLFVATVVLALLHPRIADAQAAPLRSLGFALTYFFVATAPYVVLEERAFMRYGYPGHAGLAMACAVCLQSVVEITSSRLKKRKRWHMSPMRG